MSALADAGLTRRRRAGCRSRDWPSFIWVFTYHKKFVFVFLLLHYFQTPGQEGGYWTPGQERWDKRNKIAGTDVIHE